MVLDHFVIRIGIGLNIRLFFDGLKLSFFRKLHVITLLNGRIIDGRGLEKLEFHLIFVPGGF